MIQNLRQLNLNLLLVFDALMQEQNLSRAAVRLHMSQPATSNALARLREQLGEPLFKRTASGMVPTARALAIYGPVRQALQLLQFGLGPAEAFDPDVDHLFRLAMNDYGQQRILPELLAIMAETVPKGVISVQNDDAETLPRRLATGELDMAIDYLHFDDADLRYQPLMEEELVVIGRRGHPLFRRGLSLEDYRQCSHVSLLTRAGRGSPLEIVLGSAKVRRKVGVYVPNFLAMPSIVAGTDLIATIPHQQAVMARQHFAVQLAPMPVAIPGIQVSLIWHKQQDGSPGLLWLRKQISAIAQAGQP